MGLPRPREVVRREHRAAPTPPVRSRSFDPDAARQAWRQFARGRGAHAGPALAPRPSVVPWIAALACAVILGGGWWLASRPSTKSETSAPLVVASSTAPKSASAAATAAPAPSAPTITEAPSRPVYVGAAAPSPAPLPVAAALPEAVEDTTPVVEAPRPITRTTITPHARRIPIGISPDNEKALRKLPLARGDADPVGGVGEAGIHVDDIQLGTSHARGVCSGPDRGFSLARERNIDVCLRVVHAREAQPVTVLWERAGVVVRRVRIVIPAVHAHRTRAGLPLRPDAPGRWRVRVVSDDDVELASLDFSVGR